MSDPIHARALEGIQLPSGDPPEWLMWMPAGTHDIHASRGGKSARVVVRVDAETATAVRAALTALLSSGRQRPYLDFDHDGRKASAWVTDFAWRTQPEPGVYARVEWSEEGAAALRGKTYRAFSPSFFVDSDSAEPTRPARVTGAPLNMGGLTNNPAFREIRPLWASHANPEEHMDPKELELQAAKARIAELEAESNNLKASAAAAEEVAEAIKAKDEELAKLRQTIDAKEAEVRQRAERDAATIVASAVARGVIPPKDEATQEHWRKLIAADPKNAELLVKQPGHPAITATRSTPTPSGSGQIQILATDPTDALRGYLASRDHRERGRIYQRDLDPILAKGISLEFNRLPIQAANSLGTLVGNIISQRTLATLVSMRPMLRDVVTDFSDEGARLNQSVYTRAVGLPTVQNFGSAATDSAVTDYPVQLANHKQVLFTFTAAEYNATGRNLVGEHSQALAVALGNHLVDAVAALITDAFTSETTGAGSTKTFSDITAATKALNAAGAPDYDRFGWVNGDFAEALSNDEMMEQFAASQASAYSQWQNVKGFARITEYPALPGNSVNLIGFTFQRNALLLAARTSINPAEIIGAGYPGTIEVVTDPVTGLSVVNNLWIDASSLAVNARMILLYGCARGLVGAGHKFVTS